MGAFQICKTRRISPAKLADKQEVIDLHELQTVKEGI